ncbi:putative periplasmic protein [Trabulsiella guamensis ATCC 49490]|uniref:Putative periplasmic protein n=1 Tax=Trabulsiella guamensis ATCC 49490 TaxID=1005994 RepID=A0A085AM40_9ENTR|nr:type 1 fimbrial protein [Trabulsiella guamensis]KFC11285.1 putative periplasmic protein [Trabulsiella guamensis ATCC 49490]
MTKLRMFVAAVAAISLFGTAFAAGNGPSGVIHFRGKIVEGACSVARDGTAQATFSCLRAGVNHVRAVALSQGDVMHLPKDIATVQSLPVNHHPELQLLVVSYR